MNVLKVIQQICEKHEDCVKCPFNSGSEEEKECLMDESPCDWDVAEITRKFKLFWGDEK